MDMDKDTLQLVMATAVKAETPRRYKIGHRAELLVFPDARERIVESEPEEEVNTILTIPDAVRVFQRWPAATIWVNESTIHVEHEEKERWSGRSLVKIERTAAAQLLFESDLKEKVYRPAEFERIAKLRFGADATFINRLRNLQWKTEAAEDQKIANVSKHASMNMIAKVLDKDGSLFEDVILKVRTPIFEVPFKTAEVEVDLNIIANAESQTISFAPNPGVMAGLLREAITEVFEAVLHELTEVDRDRVYMGNPVIASRTKS